MSKAKNMLTWCLNKAKREIEEGQLHRGLVKKNPDNKLAQEHVAKAEHNFEVFLYNKEKGYHDWTINIGFYIIYHCFLAILAKYGYESRNQECTLAVIESLSEDEKIGPDFKIYVDAIKSSNKKEEEQLMPMREKYQYTPSIEIDIKKVEELLRLCQDAIKETKGIIY